MRTTIDGVGRLVVPKAVRDRLQLKAGTELEIEEHDGIIEIRPVAAKIRVVQTPEGPVAAPAKPGPVLTDDLVRETLENLRFERS